MEIIATPAQRSSAYRDAIFSLSALESEQIDLDIRDETQNLLLGKKRLSGQTSYSVNVSNYAQRLLNVTPLRNNTSFFSHPEHRMASIQIQAGNTQGSVILTSGLEKIMFFEKLSKAPDPQPISPEHGDELALYTDDSALFADIILNINGQQQKIRIAEKEKKMGLCALYLSMPHVANKISDAGLGLLENYHDLELQITTEYNELVLSRKYTLEAASPKTLRLCWWNYFGQIDYYTFKLNRKSLLIDKQRIYSQQGYKTTGCQTETLYELISNCLNEENMNWLQELTAAPKVWIDDGINFIPVEILTQQIITGGNELVKMEISMTPCQKTIYQHL